MAPKKRSPKRSPKRSKKRPKKRSKKRSPKRLKKRPTKRPKKRSPKRLKKRSKNRPKKRSPKRSKKRSKRFNMHGGGSEGRRDRNAKVVLAFVNAKNVTTLENLWSIRWEPNQLLDSVKELMANLIAWQSKLDKGIYDTTADYWDRSRDIYIMIKYVLKKGLDPHSELYLKIPYDNKWFDEIYTMKSFEASYRVTHSCKTTG